MSAPEGPTLMRPAGPVDGTGLGAYLEHLSSTRGLAFDDHRDLWRWSVAEPEAFWASIWDHYGVPGDATSGCSARRRCRARSGSREPGSTTPRT